MTTPTDITEQIAEAERAGDWHTARRLKSSITFGPRPTPATPAADQPDPALEPPSIPGIDQGARHAPRARTIAEEIADAQDGGDWNRALTLKSQLTFDPFMRRLSTPH